MSLDFESSIALPDQWRRVAELRIRAISDSPQWFASNLEKETARNEEEWRALIADFYWVIYTYEGRDVGIMTVEKADPIRGTDCWLAGCWVEKDLRGKGIMAKMIEKLDEICRKEGWNSQGLGVWPSNEVAISAYTKSGFVKQGEPKPSRSKPGQLYQMMVRSLPN